MYFDNLRRRVHIVAIQRATLHSERIPIENCIAPAYRSLHEDIQQGRHKIIYLPGGRASCKSSFVSLEIVNGLMQDSTANAIIFRRYASTLRESTFAQIQWAVDALCVSALWHSSISPMQFIHRVTDQMISFRGLDDPSKIKSIKPRRGFFRFIWFEEYSELAGPNQVRNVLQSVVRGGSDFRIFASFFSPISASNWANKQVQMPDDCAICFRTTHKDVPPEWLGPAFIAEAERLQEITSTAYKHEYLGNPVDMGGMVYPNIEVRTITDDEIREKDFLLRR